MSHLLFTKSKERHADETTDFTVMKSVLNRNLHSSTSQRQKEEEKEEGEEEMNNQLLILFEGLKRNK